jgi:hypothetical protein
MAMATCLASTSGPTPAYLGSSGRHRRRLAPPRCAVTDEAGTKTTTVRSEKAGDALEVCRVVNGMWQVSGTSWGRAEPAAAVDAMLRYADGGLATFDMADICM